MPVLWGELCDSGLDGVHWSHVYLRPVQYDIQLFGRLTGRGYADLVGALRKLQEPGSQYSFTRVVDEVAKLFFTNHSDARRKRRESQPWARTNAKR